MTLLALETSCDETSAAVVRDGRVLSSAVSSQIKLHAEYGGVVPELAAREHLRNLIPVVQTALNEAKIGRADLPVSQDAWQHVCDWHASHYVKVMLDQK
jgi:N6-L-threonylcarbamoyladenine synthase